MESILISLKNETEESLSPLDMFKGTKTTIRTLILMFAWMNVCVGYYALSFSTTKLSGDIVLNYLYGTIFDSPMCILLYFTIDGLGRRALLLLSQLLLGLACIALAFIPKDASTAILIVYLVGKTAAGLAFSMVYLVTSELYPTNLRLVSPLANVDRSTNNTFGFRATKGKLSSYVSFIIT